MANGIQSALPLAAGAGGGFEIGQAVGNVVNYYAGVPADIAGDIRVMIIAAVVPVVALIAHRLMSLDLDHDGRPDLAAVSTTEEK